MNNKAIKYTTKTENNNASQKSVFVFLSLCKQNRIRKRTMPKLTTEQRVFIVTHYYETGSVDEVRRRFEEQYPAPKICPPGLLFGEKSTNTKHTVRV